MFLMLERVVFCLFFFNTLAGFFMRLHEFCFTFMKFVCRVMISCLYVNDEVGKIIFQIR